MDKLTFEKSPYFKGEKKTITIPFKDFKNLSIPYKSIIFGSSPKPDFINRIEGVVSLINSIDKGNIQLVSNQEELQRAQEELKYNKYINIILYKDDSEIDDIIKEIKNIKE